MKHTTKAVSLPTPVSDAAKARNFLADNELVESSRRLKLDALASKAGFEKRSGHALAQVLFSFVIWPFLGQRSLRMFCAESLCSFLKAGKDALYDFLKRDDLPWRDLQHSVALAVYCDGGYDEAAMSAFVADDTVKQRRGKKMEGVSFHYDHLKGRSVRGQQVTTLGHVSDKGFLPIDEQLYISSKGRQGLRNVAKDGRGIGAKRWRESFGSKIEQIIAMLRRAVRKGFRAKYFVADSWYGCRDIIVACLSLHIVPVLRMKRGNQKYRYQGAWLNADELWAKHAHETLQKIPGLPYKAATIDLLMDISTDSKMPCLQPVRLLFVRGVDPDNKKKSWALFLTTDCDLEPAKTLEIYALRWGIEVYFKEVKQHMGMLKEQTMSFASHIASIHLAALRYLLLLEAVRYSGRLKFGEVRDAVGADLRAQSYAALLWEVFRALIAGALANLAQIIGAESISQALHAIDADVNDFLDHILQMDYPALHAEDTVL